MKMFLLSRGFDNEKDEEGNTISKTILEENSLLENLRKYVNKFNNILFICNNAEDYETNDIKAKLIFQAFNKQVHQFKHYYVLDDRTKDKAEKLISKADVIYLNGGKLDCQLNFIRENNIDKFLSTSSAVIIGQSAGAMNLCKVAYNYPETDDDIGNKRYSKGLGFVNLVLIPHFNMITGNEYFPENVDLIKDYYLPDSFYKTFLAIPDKSYVLVLNDKAVLYGEAYKIKNGEIIKICENGNKILIKSKYNPDVCLPIGDSLFNYRVALLITHGDKVLLSTTPEDDFWNLPGGRVKSGEDTIHAIKREMKEELNIEINNLKLINISENFFLYRQRKAHELLFIYKWQCDDENLIKKQEIHSLDKVDEVYCWFDKDKIKEIKILPEIIYELIENDVNYLTHRIVNQIKKGN